MYEYSITEDSTHAHIYIKLGGVVAAQSMVIRHINDFENYSVTQGFRGKGLSYALTYLMMLYCSDNNITAVTVSNAHGELLKSLPACGFVLQGQIRITKGGKEQAGSFQCANINQAMPALKSMMLKRGLTFRCIGPYVFKKYK